MATAPAPPTIPQLSLDRETIEAIADALAERVADLAPQSVEDAWLDSAGAADYLALSIDALHRLTAANAIPHCQDTPGGRLYFRRSELDSWRLAGHVEPRF